MFAYTDTQRSPWFVVEGDNKKAARLNLISHLLSMVPYKRIDRGGALKLPSRQKRKYQRPPKTTERLVPVRYSVGPD